MYRYRKPGTIVGLGLFASTFEPDDWRRVGILQRFSGTSTQLFLRRTAFTA